MKLLKLDLILMAFLCAVFSIQSCRDKCEDIVCKSDRVCNNGTCECPDGFSGENCEVEDLCVTQDIICDYDGDCDNGQCVCTIFSENYLLGLWTLGSIQTFFYSDGTYEQLFDNGTWVVPIPNSITMVSSSTGQSKIYSVLDSSIDCNTHVWQFGEIQFLLRRQ